MSQQQVARVRRICLSLPETTERLSHGEPTFFVRNKAFVKFANNHHGDGHVAVWLPVPHGMQDQLIQAAPETFFKPPYVGGRGWLGIEIHNLHAYMIEMRRLEAAADFRRQPLVQSERLGARG